MRGARVIGQAEIAEAARPCALGHVGERVAAVRCDRVAMQDAAQIGLLDQRRQVAGLGARDFVTALAQFRRDPRQAEPLI